MIQLAGESFRSFLAWLDQAYPMDLKVQVCVLPGYDMLQGMDGNTGWAASIPESDTIFIPGEVPEDLGISRTDILITIAHEYVHAIQKAERRAKDIVSEYAVAIGGELLSEMLSRIRRVR